MKWEITNIQSGELVESGTGYNPSSSYTIVRCLPQECHTFSIYNYWTNPYYLSVNNTLVATGSGIWNTPESTEFGCITQSPSVAPTRAPCESDEHDVAVILDTDNFGDQTTWQITENRNNRIVESGSGYDTNTAYEIGM